MNPKEASFTTGNLPEKVYHYTSQKGLIGILREKKIWMTNINYLNDATEFRHSIELIIGELENRISILDRKVKRPAIIGPSHKESLEEKQLNIYSEIQRSFKFPKIVPSLYVSSFSHIRDDLNQ